MHIGLVLHALALQGLAGSLHVDNNSDHWHLEMSKNYGLKISVANASLALSLEDFHKIFIADQAPFSLDEYHRFAEDRNVSITPWSSSESRQLKFVKSVNLPGLASTRATKTQRIIRFANYGFCVFSSTRCPWECFALSDIEGMMRPCFVV